MLLSILECKDQRDAQWNKVAEILCMQLSFILDEKVSICNMEKKLWAKVTNSTEILCKYLIFMQETFSIQNSAVSLISESTISY